ncbi:MAG: DUF6580 family putative transport protein [Planctomycetota bacterium]
MNLKRFFVVVSLIAVAVASRLLPHPPNFTAIGAMALFAGATLQDRRLAFGLPIGVMLLTDWAIGFHAVVPFVYVATLLYVALGQWAGRGQAVNRMSMLRMGGATLLGSIMFFLITNVGCWWAFYDHTASALIACFTAAIPYFQWTLAGDVVFVAVLLIAMGLVESMMPSLRDRSDAANLSSSFR